MSDKKEPGDYRSDPEYVAFIDYFFRDSPYIEIPSHELYTFVIDKPSGKIVKEMLL